MIKFKKWADIPENLKTTNQLRSLNLKPHKNQTALGTIWSNRRWVSLYEISDAIEVKKLSEEQREAHTRIRTCENCHCTWHVIPLNKDGKRYCEGCQSRMALEKKKELHKQELRTLLEDDYLILDTDTTDLEPGEICRISIMNRNEKIIFDSLLKFENDVSLGAQRIYQLTKERLCEEPNFNDVHEELSCILSGKTVFIYNKNFDLMFLEATYYRYNVRPIEFNAVCAMELQSQILIGDTSTYFKLTDNPEILKSTRAKLHCTFNLLHSLSK